LFFNCLTGILGIPDQTLRHSNLLSTSTQHNRSSHGFERVCQKPWKIFALVTWWPQCRCGRLCCDAR